jgi:hypothetical protein
LALIVLSTSSADSAPIDSSPAATGTPEGGLASTLADADTRNTADRAAAAVITDTGDTTGATTTLQTAQRTATAGDSADTTDTTTALQTANVGINISPLRLNLSKWVGEISRAHSQKDQCRPCIHCGTPFGRRITSRVPQQHHISYQTARIRL